VLPRGRSTVDFDAGFPYYFGGRITVGAGRIPNLAGFDATVAVRTMFARTELGLGARMTVVDNNPFSAAAFTNIWWGSKLLDDSKRNGVTWDVGGAISLSALSHVTITGKAFAELWSDRFCPALDSTMPNGFEGSDPIKVCVDAQNNRLSATEMSVIRKTFGRDAVPTDLFNRQNGARFLISMSGEIAFDQYWNFYFILEGAPFQQDERALFTSLFSAPMPDNDPRVYGRIGLTYKF